MVTSGVTGFISPVALALKKAPKPRIKGFFGKSCRAATPATTGARAIGICGSVSFAQCSSPAMTYLWIAVWNVSCTCATLPENSITVRPFETRATCSVRLEPQRDGPDVFVRSAELPSELFRREPFVKVRRGPIQLLVEYFSWRGLLL